jgi:single-stranded-DNA-specific exonuclease
MPNPKKRWQIPPRLPPGAQAVLADFPPILHQLLYNRGYASPDEARRYLEARPPRETTPAAMLGVQPAVERIRHAIHQDELIAVYGDYDADGVTATALLTLALQSQGARVRPYIPNRFDEGYGLNVEALNVLKDEGARLVITVDCGVRSPEEARHAHKIGLDLVITDHHHPGGELPECLAVINPKQPGDAYPEKDLAGVGLAYKLASALAEPWPPPEDLLDLVALGTVADLAPLVGENRYLVRQGLLRLRDQPRQGVLSLARVAGLNPQRINAGDIGFILGPRLNAAGRLESALAALELLLTDDLFQAGQLAQQLDDQNRERQRLTRQIQAQAEQIALAEDPEARLLFAAHPEFSHGVVGLAASRLTEAYYRPAIVAHAGEEYTRGSCRSIPEFHITQALDRCQELLERHGGHAAAAGFTVHNRNLPELVARLRLIADEQLASLDLRPTLTADQEIRLTDLKPAVLEYLDWLEPTGYGNPQAVFVARRVKVQRSQVVGKDASHLKLVVTDGRITFDAIAFRMGHLQAELPPYIDLMFTFEVNEFNGRTTFQLRVRDLKPAGEPD